MAWKISKWVSILMYCSNRNKRMKMKRRPYRELLSSMAGQAPLLQHRSIQSALPAACAKDCIRRLLPKLLSIITQFSFYLTLIFTFTIFQISKLSNDRPGEKYTDR
jgi:hypothetical protein